MNYHFAKEKFRTDQGIVLGHHMRPPSNLPILTPNFHPSHINPRFNLTTPLISGLFYIAPGTGFLVGSIVGGRLSDRTVKRYIKKRNGLRLPQGRLNSGLLTLVGVLPVATLVYGWNLQEKVGGLALPIVCALFGGAGLMGSFYGLNTYTAEVLPEKRSEVISGKYIVQYIFGAGSSAAVVPCINAIGVGWTFTICKFGSDYLVSLRVRC